MGPILLGLRTFNSVVEADFLEAILTDIHVCTDLKEES